MGIKQWQKGHLPLNKTVKTVQRRTGRGQDVLNAIADNTYKD
jgi:hypothetical protein